MIRRDVLPSGARLLQNDTTRVRVWLEAPTLLAWLIDGHGGIDIVQKVIGELDDLCPREGEFVVFNDTERMPGYDPGFRNLLTDWSGSKGKRLRAIHILTRSRVVAMGAAVANMMLGGNVTMYADRIAFEAAFVAAGGARKRFLEVA